MTIINACYSSAAQGIEFNLHGLARLLVELRMPCAIGMGTKITDNAAFEFTEWLYTGFSENKAIRRAFYAAVEEF